MEPHQIKYIVKETVHQVKRQPTKWEKTVVNYTVQDNLIGIIL